MNLKMEVLKFSHDYMKLPYPWEGTQALLIGVIHIPDMELFKNRYPQIMVADTKIRDEEGSYPIVFKEGLLLTFFHFNSHQIFITIRRYTIEKLRYYLGSRMKPFELKRVKE